MGEVVNDILVSILIFTKRKNHLSIKDGYYLLMMRLRVFNIILVLLILAIAVQGQNLVKGVVYNSTNNNVLQNVELYDNSSGYITKTNREGAFKFYTKKEDLSIGLLKTYMQVLIKHCKVLF